MAFLCLSLCCLCSSKIGTFVLALHKITKNYDYLAMEMSVKSATRLLRTMFFSLLQRLGPKALLHCYDPRA
jgi:hypothetical protein